jgi:hypothetical protein
MKISDGLGAYAEPMGGHRELRSKGDKIVAIFVDITSFSDSF